MKRRISDLVVAMIDKALGKRRSYGEPSTTAPTLKRVRWKNGCRFMAVTNMNATFNKLSIFACCVPMLLENFIEILNRWSSICSHCPFDKAKKMFYKYIYMYIYIYIYIYIFIFIFIKRVYVCLREIWALCVSVCHRILMTTYLAQH